MFDSLALEVLTHPLRNMFPEGWIAPNPRRRPFRQKILQTQQKRNLGLVTRRWIESIQKRLRSEYDEVIFIEGYEGSGKSSLAWWLAKAIDKEFSASRMVMSGKQFTRTANKLYPASAIVWDETIEGGFSRRAMSRQNVETASWLTVSRARCICSIIVMPDMHWLDSLMREHRVRWRLKVDQRGLVKIMAPGEKNMDGSRSWQTVHRFRYPKPAGHDWDTYYKKKLEMISRVLKGKDEEED